MVSSADRTRIDIQTLTGLKLAALAMLLSACTYTPMQPGSSYPPPVHEPEAAPQDMEVDADAQTPPEPERVAVVTPDAVERAPVQSQLSAAEKLRSQAREAMDYSDYDKAERLLNRALRLAPRDAATYYQWALLKLQRGEPGRALQLARKGLSLQPLSELARRLRAVENEALAQSAG